MEKEQYERPVIQTIELNVCSGDPVSSPTGLRNGGFGGSDWGHGDNSESF